MRGIGSTEQLIEFSFSSAAADLPFAVFQRIAHQSRNANPRCGLTGELRLEAGRFTQILEGRSSPVLALVARILADPRHSAIRVATCRRIAARRFSVWRTIGFEVGGSWTTGALPIGLSGLPLQLDGNGQVSGAADDPDASRAGG